MRDERRSRRERPGLVRLDLEATEASGRLVVEAEKVSKAFDGRAVVGDFSTRIMRGDRIGIIGPNGVGKTTLLQLLLGTLPPDRGEVRHGANVQIAYYDQQREQLDPERTVAETVGDGNDTVTVNGRSRHVNGYLRDFLFAPERARSPVKALSGGERNRLLLARLFTRPANLLVLDEPTNDLDLETLELLESQLVEWSGTLLLVSHDRSFLDNVVTSTMVFDGDGQIREYVGGYDEWERQRDALRETGTAAADSPSAAQTRDRRRSNGGASQSGRLSYKERREFDELPASIEALEAEQRELTSALESPDFYKEAASTIEQVLARLDEIRARLDALYERWDALDSRA
jgi:ATP-binding cassette subfamily F protein uup